MFEGKMVNFRQFLASEFEINNERMLCGCDVHVLDLHCTEHIHQILILFMIGVTRILCDADGLTAVQQQFFM